MQGPDMAVSPNRVPRIYPLVHTIGALARAVSIRGGIIPKFRGFRFRV